MSFAFLDSCDTGANAQMATAFLYPSTSTADVAEMGWRCDAKSSWGHYFTWTFYDSLNASKTVDDAEKDGWRVLVQNDPGDPLLSGGMASALTVYGDKYTRLHGLYNGQDGTAPSLWYKVTVN